ncbi:MAG: PAS domain S-box protein [Candidatus Delongbacteria bacterium]|nr:PAS domain S-box protein [Candidatus Delongbacteria bacterium]
MNGSEDESGFRRYNFRNLMIVLSVLYLFLVFSGWVLYNNFRHKMIDEIKYELISVANMKNREICHWREERIKNLSILQNEVFGLRVKRTVENPDDPRIQNEMLDWLKKFEENYGYSRVCIHNFEGTEIISTQPGESHMPDEIESYYERIFGKNEILFEDFYFDMHQKKIYLPLVAGMFDFTGNKKAVGILIAKLDPSDYLLPLLKEWPGNRKTTNSFLYRLKNDNTVLMDFGTVQNEDLPLIDQNLTEDVFKESHDNRNIEYFTYTSKIHNTPWYLLVQIEKNEALAPLKSSLAGIILVLALIIILFTVGIYHFYKKQTYDHLKEIAAKSFELEQSEERYRGMFENTHAIMFIVDPENGQIIDANPAAVQKYGWTRDELKSMNVSDINTLSHEKSVEKVREVADGKRRYFVFQHKKKNGEIIDVELFSGTVEFSGKKVLYSIVHDITEKLAEIETGRRKLLGLIEALKELTGSKTEKEIEAIFDEWAVRLVNAKNSKIFFRSNSRFEPSSKDMIANVWGKEYDPSEIDIEIFKTLSDSVFIAFENVKLYSEMDDKVKSRTNELTEKTTELEKRTKELEDHNEKLIHFQHLFNEREFRIKELKDRIKELENKYEKNSSD